MATSKLHLKKPAAGGIQEVIWWEEWWICWCWLARTESHSTENWSPCETDMLALGSALFQILLFLFLQIIQRMTASWCCSWDCSWLKPSVVSSLGWIWCQKFVAFHISFALSQSIKTCHSFSKDCGQKQQCMGHWTPFEINIYRVGKHLLRDLHKKFFILGGILWDQTSLQSACILICSFDKMFSIRWWYAVLTE